MSKKSNYNIVPRNREFFDSAILNNLTFIDYMNRFKKIALSIFEWVNLPSSMDARYLEHCLFYNGVAALLKDGKFGFINTKCASSGNINIYGLPTSLNCSSFGYTSTRKIYTGLDGFTENQRKYLENSQAILVMNDWERVPTCSTLELFAYRLYECERTCDTNIKMQKFPMFILTDEKQRLTYENLFSQYDGNRPVILGDKYQVDPSQITSINTNSPFVADKIMNYKKQIWNEALTFLGINNISDEKKERLVTDEINSNNELINLNLQSYLAPRQLACKQFNEKFNFTGTDKEISVRVRSDLKNIIKNAISVVQDFKDSEDIENIQVKEENTNG